MISKYLKAMLVPAMERLHYIDELSMFLVNVGAGDGKTALYRWTLNVLGNVGAGDGKTTLYR